MNRKFIVGPPGTGKTRDLVNLYYEKIQLYPIERTQIISHTNIAADEICERIYNKENAKRYEQKNNVIIWDNLSCLHARTDWPREEARTLRRVTIEGEVLA